MVKKASCFSAIKRVVTCNLSEKPANQESDKKYSKEKKRRKGILKHGESKSFIPLFKEPSSIEEILGEADHLYLRPPTFLEKTKTPPVLLEQPTSPGLASPKGASPVAISPKAVSPVAISPKVVSPAADFLKADAPKVTQCGTDISNVQMSEGPEPTLKDQYLSATMIQAAYRGYMTRKSFRSLRGLGRLQEAMRGQSVKRQTESAMKQTQLFVRVQTQIQFRRIQMLENQALQHQVNRNSKEVESTLSKWIQLSEAGNHEDWDASSLSKEEVEARLRKKVEAAVKRERAMSYAKSHQLRKSNQKATQIHSYIQANGYPRWWNWLEQQQLPPSITSSQHQPNSKNLTLISPMSPRLHAKNYDHTNSTFDNHEPLMPRSSRSSIPSRAKKVQTHSYKPRTSAANSVHDVPFKDDDSLMSCSAFSSASYMTPTVSAKAKVRANSIPKERFVRTPDNDSKRRSSFPLTPNIGSSKGTSLMVLEKCESSHSAGHLSVDSAVSKSAVVGRKPFNRFV